LTLMMLSKRPMRFFTSPLLVPCCAYAKTGGLLRSRTVSGAIQQGCARVFDPKKDGAARACAFQRARHGLSDLKAELLAFSNGRHDDIVDPAHRQVAIGKSAGSLCRAVSGARVV